MKMVVKCRQFDKFGPGIGDGAVGALCNQDSKSDVLAESVPFEVGPALYKMMVLARHNFVGSVKRFIHSKQFV